MVVRRRGYTVLPSCCSGNACNGASLKEYHSTKTKRVAYTAGRGNLTRVLEL